MEPHDHGTAQRKQNRFYLFIAQQRKRLINRRCFELNAQPSVIIVGAQLKPWLLQDLGAPFTSETKRVRLSERFRFRCGFRFWRKDGELSQQLHSARGPACHRFTRGTPLLF